MQPPIKIGRGFHINDVYRQTRACFTPESCSPQLLTSQQTGGKTTNINIQYTRSRQEYEDFLMRGGSGEIGFLNLFALGGQKLKVDYDATTDDEENIIFAATVDFGTYTYDADPLMVSEAKALLEQSNYDDFIKYYGTHYISGIRKASRVLVILSRQNNANETLALDAAEIKAKVPLSSNASLSAGGGDLSLINKKLDTEDFTVSIEIEGPALDENSLKLQIEQTLRDKYNTNKASSISSIIQAATKNISDPGQGIITHYYYSPFTLYGLNNVSWDEKKQQQLIKINETVLAVSSAQKLVDEFLSAEFETEFKKELTDIEFNDANIKAVIYKFSLAKPHLRLLQQNMADDFKTLEDIYIACADVRCASTSVCCNNEIFGDIKSKDYNQLIMKEFQPVYAEMERIWAEKTKESEPECEKNQSGTIIIKNLSSNPYYIYQGDNLIETLPGNSQTSYDVKAGTYYFTAKQKSGYVFYPTENERRAIISTPCESVTLTIGYED